MAPYQPLLYIFTFTIPSIHHGRFNFIIPSFYLSLHFSIRRIQKLGLFWWMDWVKFGSFLLWILAHLLFKVQDICAQVSFWTIFSAFSDEFVCLSMFLQCPHAFRSLLSFEATCLAEFRVFMCWIQYDFSWLDQVFSSWFLLIVCILFASVCMCVSGSIFSWIQYNKFELIWMFSNRLSMLYNSFSYRFLQDSYIDNSIQEN